MKRIIMFLLVSIILVGCSENSEQYLTAESFIDQYNPIAEAEALLTFEETEVNERGYIVTTAEDALEGISIKVNENEVIDEIKYSGGNYLHVLAILEALGYDNTENYDSVVEAFDNIEQSPVHIDWEEDGTKVVIAATSPEIISMNVSAIDD
ncbi:hypothetical protein J6TS1_19970 [Siminovitchia terrae]|uniref:Lipoprotein n=1 Tax=Siminovitchia terrae TaxID=1914933 RepID=A0ABQ4KXX1_SIMTE|nr:hypothetical protein [Siminovitchia terrae]GIN96127.1 hypothetical protein J6TS1_19970 [Siminovitchia terrae]